MAHPNRLYTFECPECANQFTYDEPGEPMCTGPGETDDIHEPKVMRRIRVRDRDREVNVSPEEGAQRAKGTLLTAETLVAMKARVNGRLWTPKDGINPLTGEEMDDRRDDGTPGRVEIHDVD